MSMKHQADINQLYKLLEVAGRDLSELEKQIKELREMFEAKPKAKTERPKKVA